MREESLCFIFVSSKDSIYNYPDHLLLPPDSLIVFVKDCVGSSLSHVQDPQVNFAHIIDLLSDSPNRLLCTSSLSFEIHKLLIKVSFFPGDLGQGPCEPCFQYTD